MNLIDIVSKLVLAMLSMSLLMTCVRLFRGPTLPDRVVALDMVSTLAVGLIAVYAIHENQSVYLADAIVLAVISFLGTIAFAYYVGKGGNA